MRSKANLFGNMGIHKNHAKMVKYPPDDIEYWSCNFEMLQNEAD